MSTGVPPIIAKSSDEGSGTLEIEIDPPETVNESVMGLVEESYWKKVLKSGINETWKVLPRVGGRVVSAVKVRWARSIGLVKLVFEPSFVKSLPTYVSLGAIAEETVPRVVAPGGVLSPLF